MKKRIGTYNGKPLVVGDKNLLNSNEIHSDVVNAESPKYWGFVLPVPFISQEENSCMYNFIVKIEPFGKYPYSFIKELYKELGKEIIEIGNKESMTTQEEAFVVAGSKILDQEMSFLGKPTVFIGDNIEISGIDECAKGLLECFMVNEPGMGYDFLQYSILDTICYNYWSNGVPGNDIMWIGKNGEIEDTDPLLYSNCVLLSYMYRMAMADGYLSFYVGKEKINVEKYFMMYQEIIQEIMQELEEEGLMPATYNARKKTFDELVAEAKEKHKEKIEAITRALNIKKLRENG